MIIKLNNGDLACNYHGFILDPYTKYVINMDDELSEQVIYSSKIRQNKIKLKAIDDYHKWLKLNNIRFPTNENVAPHYGNGPLWETENSIGLVVLSESDNFYYIVVECSELAGGFKHAQIVVTINGCI